MTTFHDPEKIGEIFGIGIYVDAKLPPPSGVAAILDYDRWNVNRRRVLALVQDRLFRDAVYPSSIPTGVRR